MSYQIQILQSLQQVFSDFETNEDWQRTIEKAQIHNQWFQKDEIYRAIHGWQKALSSENIDRWVSTYKWKENQSEKVVGLILAGNIPFVGLHDILVSVLAGFSVKVKCASDDEVLPKFIVERAATFNDAWKRIQFTEQLKQIDLAIATGSNNSSKYFEYYFRNIPHLLRKNRNSVAVLSGNESEEEIIGLGHDVFDYYGLGCRNVTKIYLPQDYEFKKIFDVWEREFAQVAFHNKYVNNYNYHKALLLMNLDPHIDAGFILLKEREDLYSPVGMLNYQYYNSVDDLNAKLKLHSEDIQCITSSIPEISKLNLGQAQCPMLWDYADGVDTLKWMLDLN